MMDDKAAAEEFCNYGGDVVVIGDHRFRFEGYSQGRQETADWYIDRDNDIDFTVKRYKESTSVRGWEISKAKIYGKPMTIDLGLIKYPKPEYRGPCIVVGHEMIESGGRQRWCNHCDRTENWSMEGGWK